MITLSQVRTGIGEHRMCLETHPGLEFTSVVIDSRLATPEALFVALRGEQSDGHTYIRDAWERGARGVIAERETPLDWLPEDKRTGFAYLTVPDSLVALQSLAHHWRRQHRARVIAITGSVGKTTTRQMVAAVLSRQYRVLSSEGNLNTETGVPLTLMRLDDSHERAVIEMGMYGLGEISALCRIAEPEIGVVTNVGPSHLERLGSIERIAKAKGELPAALPAEGWVVLNGDDIRVRPMASKARRIFFGTNLPGAGREVRKPG
jgi:UDP-N-acetylmuramoyl-tripeptide--D-alanyl-D-alanine ligase